MNTKVQVMYKESRVDNASNPHQGAYKKVLCVCSAGLLRSPTAALVLSQKPFGFNTRSCGIEPEYALIQLDKVLLAWADEIVCMTPVQERRIRQMTSKSVICLNIEDSYGYRDKWLMKKIKQEYLNRSHFTGV